MMMAFAGCVHPTRGEIWIEGFLLVAVLSVGAFIWLKMSEQFLERVWTCGRNAIAILCLCVLFLMPVAVIRGHYTYGKQGVESDRKDDLRTRGLVPYYNWAVGGNNPKYSEFTAYQHFFMQCWILPFVLFGLMLSTAHIWINFGPWFTRLVTAIGVALGIVMAVCFGPDLWPYLLKFYNGTMLDNHPSFNRPPRTEAQQASTRMFWNMLFLSFGLFALFVWWRDKRAKRL